MSVTGVFTSGKASGHPGATAILKYIPRPRVPWQPSRFGRANLEDKDLAALWGKGRYRTGSGSYNSGYSTEKTHVLEDHSISMIPKHELEAYMPDISIGSKALVTPVSLMNARNGHRVTHDMLHSYDAYIGRVGAPATVDHENITPEDPNRVGLNAATLDCRGRIHRWLRRGPFFQEDQYFRRSVSLTRNSEVPAVPAHELPLVRSVVRLARRGHLKAACEEYRRFTGVPPVEVYRALTAACVPGRHLADAIAIVEDGNARLFYVARDGEVLYNVMKCAIAARHRVRVLWVYNLMRGRYYENVLVRAEIEPVWRYRIAAAALEFLLDTHAEAEARAVYEYLASEGLLDCDLHVIAGTAMREALKQKKPVSAAALLSEEGLKGLAAERDARAVAPEVARALYQRYTEEMSALWRSVGAEGQAKGNAAAVVLPSPEGLDAAGAVAWLAQHYPDVCAVPILRLARFRRQRKDLIARDRPAYVARAALWIEQLSLAHQQREEAPLPYLLKSRPSLTNTAVRVAYLPQGGSTHNNRQLLASEEGCDFFYSPHVRMVQESFEHVPEDTLRARLLAQTPVHTELPAALDFVGAAAEAEAAALRIGGGGEVVSNAILHPSVMTGVAKGKQISSGAPSSASSGNDSSRPSSSATTKSVKSNLDDEKLF